MSEFVSLAFEDAFINSVKSYVHEKKRENDIREKELELRERELRFAAEKTKIEIETKYGNEYAGRYTSRIDFSIQKWERS